MGAIKPKINEIDITPSSAGWQTVDVSSYVESGATGIFIRARYSGSDDSSYFRFKKHGLDDNLISHKTFKNSDDWGRELFCGIDSNGLLDIYIPSSGLADFQICLTAETTDEVVVFDEPVLLPDPSSGDSWVDTDISSYMNAGDSGNSVAAILFIEEDNLNTKNFGLRINGSTDTYLQRAEQKDGYVTCIVGIDSNNIFERYYENNTDEYDMYLVGYIKGGITMIENPSSESIIVDNTWRTLDISGSVPASADSVLVNMNVYSAAASRVSTAMSRAVGSTDSEDGHHCNGNTAVDSGSALFAVYQVQLNAEKEIEYIIDANTTESDLSGLRVIGYTESNSGTEYTLTADTKSNTITQYSANLLASRLLTAQSKTNTLTRYSAAILAGRKLVASVKENSITRFDALLKAKRVLFAQEKNNIIERFDAHIIATRKLIAQSKTNTIMKYDAFLKASRRLVAETKTNTITRFDAILTYTVVVVYTLVAETKTNIITKYDATLLAKRKIIAQTKENTITRYSAGLYRTCKLIAQSKENVIISYSAILRASRVLVATVKTNIIRKYPARIISSIRSGLIGFGIQI